MHNATIQELRNRGLVKGDRFLLTDLYNEVKPTSPTTTLDDRKSVRAALDYLRKKGFIEKVNSGTKDGNWKVMVDTSRW